MLDSPFCLGAYLDRRQPDGGRTVFPSVFYNDHGRDMIPYATWEAVDNPAE
jgi:hypothetical protein